MANGNGGIPEGMAGLEGHGDGKVEMMIFPDNRTKQVIQRFQRPMIFIAYDLTNVVAVGKRLIDCAVEIGAQVTIEVPKRKISPEKREAIIARAMHVIRSTQEQGKKPEFTARAVVDSIINAID